MRDLIVFKTKTFPTISETFIVTNVVEAINAGFDIVIVTNKKQSIYKSSQPDLIEKNSLQDKTVVFSQPVRKVERFCKAMMLLRHPKLFYYYIKYIRLKGKPNLHLLFQLHFYMKYRKAKAFHVHFANVIDPLIALKRIGFLKSKIILTFHGHDAHFLPEEKELQEMIYDLKKYVENITVNSNYLKSKLIAKGFDPVNIEIIPIGINTDYFRPKKTSKNDNSLISLITIGRLVELKGIHLGLGVVEQLVKKGYSVSYSIVGEGKELLNLKTLAKSLGIEKNVKFLGRKNQEEIRDLLDAHHLYLMTSTLDKDNRREAFGLVSLEAQAMGLPVIGFDSGGFPETIIDGKTGILVKDKDVEAMVAAVEKLVNLKDIFFNMSEQARKYILNNFSIEKTTGRYLDFYK